MRDGLNELPTDESDEDGDESGHVRALLGAYALGALDAAESERVTRHVAGCPQCRAELEAYEAAAGQLAWAATPRAVPLRARAALLGRIAAIGIPGRGDEPLRTLPSSPAAEPRRRVPRLPRWSAPRVAAFASVPLLVLVALVIAMGDRISDQQQEIATLEEQQGESARTIAGADLADPREYGEFVSSQRAPDAEAKLIVNSRENSALILAIGLPQPAEGEQFVVWLAFADSIEYARAGALTVDEQGRAMFTLAPNDPLARYEGVLVTAETNPDVTMPTGPELMTAGLAPGE